MRRFRILTPDLEAAWTYGQTYRYLRDNGLLIGANDLWTAAVAIVHGLPLVTRNGSHFGRVPGLDVVTYGPWGCATERGPPGWSCFARITRSTSFPRTRRRAIICPTDFP